MSCYICGICCVCCQCEWLGTVETPYYACCGNICYTVTGITAHMAFCSSSNEHQCRNCVLCAAPCLLTTLLSPVIAISELFCMSTCGCCGYINGRCCECLHYVDTLKTQGLPSLREISGMMVQHNRS
jgi:hypothetical protein